MLHLDFLMSHARIRANGSGVNFEAMAEQAQEKLGELIAQVIPQPPAPQPVMEDVSAPTLRQRAAKRTVKLG